MIEISNNGGSIPSTGSVSIVVPTYNRAAMLDRVLGSYFKQDFVKEVIVVDNGSTDGTPELLKDWAAREPLLRVVRLEVNMLQSGARNAGAKAATGDFVFYGEDDYEVTPGQVATLMDHMERTGADMIAGRRINVWAGETNDEALRRVNSYTDPLIERWAFVVNHHMDTGVDVESPLLCSCSLIRRELFDHISFDMGLKGNGWREETEFQLSALELGYKLVHCPHTLGFHYSGGKTGKAQGGSRDRSRLSYEMWVILNNSHIMRKHWRFLRSGGCALRVAPTVGLAAAMQTGFRVWRAVRKSARLAARRIDGLLSPRYV